VWLLFAAVRENRPDRIVIAGPDSAERFSVVLSGKIRFTIASSGGISSSCPISSGKKAGFGENDLTRTKRVLQHGAAHN